MNKIEKDNIIALSNHSVENPEFLLVKNPSFTNKTILGHIQIKKIHLNSDMKLSIPCIYNVY